MVIIYAIAVPLVFLGTRTARPKQPRPRNVCFAEAVLANTPFVSSLSSAFPAINSRTISAARSISPRPDPPGRPKQAGRHFRRHHEQRRRQDETQRRLGQANRDVAAEHDPGHHPTISDRRPWTSTEPRNQCPMPATSVSGTALAISEPTIRAAGSFG